jgi:hypothetical protein
MGVVDADLLRSAAPEPVDETIVSTERGGQSSTPSATRRSQRS